MSLAAVSRRSLPTLLVLLTVLTATPAAAMTALEAKCRERLAESFTNVVKYGHRALRICHGRRHKGYVPASTDCNDPAVADSLTGNYAAGAGEDLRKVLDVHCKDVPAVLAQFTRCPAAGRFTDDGGPTTGIDTFEELADCLSFQFDDILGRTAEAILGVPDVPLERDAARCHLGIVKSVAKLVYHTMRDRAECQVAMDDEGGPISYACGDGGEEFRYRVESLAEKLASKCELSAAVVDSCAATPSGIAECAILDHAARTAGGFSALAWELPGTCPGGIHLRFDYDAEANEVDTGWSGHNHDSSPVGDYDAALYALACDADCMNCTGTSPFVPADHCRCDSDASVQCSDDADCPGDSCTCYLAPPTHVAAGGTPYCALTPIDSPMTGAVDIAAGAASLDVQVRQRISYGLLTRSCPVCTDGVCDGGARDGLACSPDAVDDSSGSTSFDCPPPAGSSLTGQGPLVRVSLSTGPSSLGFDLPCDAPLDGLSCACSTCSLDNQIACNSDAECADLAAGVCRTDGLHDGAERRPNSCSDQICAADSATEGRCANDPDDLFCDGFVEANGRGVIACGSNADCEVLAGVCPGNADGHCGTCTVAQPRNCFLDPIVASGSAGSTMAGTGCMPPTSKPSLNTVYGIPGPYRIVQDFSFHRPMCADGVTPFEEPGGSSCP